MNRHPPPHHLGWMVWGQHTLFLIFGTPRQSWPRSRCRLKTSWRQVHWQTTSRAFTCTPLGLNPETSYEVPGSQTGAIPLSHHPGMDMTLFHSVVSSSHWPQREKQNPKLRSSREGNENTCSETTHTQHDIWNWFTSTMTSALTSSVFGCVWTSQCLKHLPTDVFLSQARRMYQETQPWFCIDQWIINKKEKTQNPRKKERERRKQK